MYLRFLWKSWRWQKSCSRFNSQDHPFWLEVLDLFLVICILSLIPFCINAFFFGCLLFAIILCISLSLYITTFQNFPLVYFTIFVNKIVFHSAIFWKIKFINLPKNTLLYWVLLAAFEYFNFYNQDIWILVSISLDIRYYSNHAKMDLKKKFRPMKKTI